MKKVATGLSLLVCLLCASTLVMGQTSDVVKPAADQTITDVLADGTQGGRIIALYNAAVATMRKTCDDYRRIKALELSVTVNVPFREAYGNINDVMPVLDKIDFALLRKPVQLPDQIQPHKDEIAKVQQQVEMMIELTEKLLEEIEQSKVVIKQHLEDQQELKLEDIVEQEPFDPEKQPEKQAQQSQAKALQDSDEQMQKLKELAQVDDKRFKDLSSAMRQVMAKQQIKPQSLQKQDAKQQAHQPQTGGAHEQKREEIKAQSQQLTEAEKKELLKLSRPKPQMGTLGRMVTQDGDPTEWLFVDTWYTIGPFPNPSRVNLNRKFPPESVVDMDAVYTGKDGRAIRWQFQQSRKLQVIPIDGEPYGIWYAYTELYFDKDMDLWIAVGSDDKANIWVNGLPVWISGDQLKSWSPNEGYRKVAFKAGRNRILYRVENGWHGIMYSLAVHLAP